MRLTTAGPKSGHLAGVLWQTDSRPRIALLQSLVSINQDHVRMTTGGGPLIYRATLPRSGSAGSAAQCGAIKFRQTGNRAGAGRSGRRDRARTSAGHPVP